MLQAVYLAVNRDLENFRYQMRYIDRIAVTFGGGGRLDCCNGRLCGVADSQLHCFSAFSWYRMRDLQMSDNMLLAAVLECDCDIGQHHYQACNTSVHHGQERCLVTECSLLPVHG